MSREVVIDRRFRGPPQSANGGYACGVVAEHIHGVASVTLRMPPPLDTALTVTGDGESSRLMEGDRLVGDGTRSSLDIEVPEMPTIDEAIEGSRRYAGFVSHIFEECFVCGPARAIGDGLRIFAGPVEDRGIVAAPWSPDESLRGEGGLVDRRHVWAALDCPSYFGLGSGPMALLGRLTAEIERLPEVGEPLIAIGWPMSVEGRKHFAGSALATDDGVVLATAAALWIEIDALPV